jgi:type VI secretion system secreted protein VgrG
MAQYTQANRPFAVHTPLGEDVLLLERFTGEESISTPFRFVLDMLSEDASITPEKLLRKDASVTLRVSDDEERVIHGWISRFVQLGRTDAGLTSYRAELVPWLWFLSLSSDCRIFQHMTVLEIVEKVFTDLGYKDFQSKCVKSYPQREYCVQYRETHFDFVSRLLEEEGIFYFFDHSKSKHTLVLADGTSAVQYGAGPQSVRMSSTGSGGIQESDVILELEREHAVCSGKITLSDYDYLKPSSSLRSSISGDQKGERHDYPGKYTKKEEGERYARLQLEAQEALQLVVRGKGSCTAFQSGCRFDLAEHYRRDANQTYQLLRVRHQGATGGYRSGEDTAHTYENDFTAIPYSIPYRPQRTVPRPVVHGSQTALVVGKKGEEIWVDKYGRVKVQFYWDREGKQDGDSSCWVRVSSTWAGKNWGAIQIPRVGQEVIVDFLEGDPDCPIITGRVYNAEQMPPYALPANQTQSGVKTRSSKGGGTENFNELRFEDKKGSEEIFVHAEKDLKTEVENDETRDELHDRTTTIKNNETKTVSEGNESITIAKGNQDITVSEGNQSITVAKGNQDVKVSQGNQAITISQGNQTVDIKMGNQTVTLDNGNQSTTLKMGNMTTKMSLGKSATEAMQSIELKVGGSSIKIDQMGVTIKGMAVKIDATMQAEVKGMMTQVNGNGMLKLQGGITMIN